jgi:protein O-GlcNAc transferase
VAAAPLIDVALEHRRAGRLDEAIALCRRILQDQPRHVDALNLLAEVLEALGRAGEAVGPFERALERSPRDPSLHLGLADLWHAQGELPRAVASYEQAVVCGEASARVWWGLGCASAALGDHAAAAEAFQHLVRVEPGHGMGWTNLGKARFELGQVEAAVDAFRRAVELLPAEAAGLPLASLATVIPGDPRARLRDVFHARRAWAERCAPRATAVEEPSPPAPGADRPLRLGYLSAFFSRRNWMKPVWGLINHHDRARFEIHLFSDGPESAVRHGYLRHPTDRFHDTSGLSNAELARLVSAQRIDVLIDLNAYSRFVRLPAFALRPAPVQVAWFNMFATSGMDCFDTLIGDDHVFRVGEEPFYTEPVVRVAGSYLTFEVTYPVPDVAIAPALARGGLTFGCLAPQYKITAQVIEAWSRILDQASGSRLFLKNVVLGRPSAREFVQGLFTRFGVAADRVEMGGPAEHFAFLERYGAIDVALDTFPYNGGTTTMEALWQGVPVLTFEGDRWAARIGASLMRAADLGDFVAADLDGYVAKAVELARDPETPARLNDLRGSMRDRLRAAPVCDVDGFARHMERLYTDLWQGRRGGR